MESKMNTFGVIIARFQVPELHLGHAYLIRQVMKAHERVVILLGVNTGAATDKNPLSFFVRKKMLNQHFPSIDIEALPDILTDDILWSESIDSILSKYPGEPIIYGSRDNSLNYYHGKHKTKYIEAVYERSGTDVRNELIEPIHTANFRAGIIHQIMNRWPIVYSTVDIAVISNCNVLLGRKTNENKFRFPGGFINVGETAEFAAKRELHEEVGLMETATWKMLGTQPIDDPRYRGTKDGILTHMFLCHHMYGQPKAADDLAEVKWFTLAEMYDKKIVMELHHPLVDMVKTALTKAE